MARQSGPILLSGTLQDFTFYEMKGQYYVRVKSRLNRQRFLKDPAFGRSRERAVQFGVAARLAAGVYRLLPKERCRHGLIGRLTGIANRGLQAGKSKQEVIAELKVSAGIDIQGQKKTGTAPPQPMADHNKPVPVLSAWRIDAGGRLQKSIFYDGRLASWVQVHGSSCMDVLVWPDG